MLADVSTGRFACVNDLIAVSIMRLIQAWHTAVDRLKDQTKKPTAGANCHQPSARTENARHHETGGRLVHVPDIAVTVAVNKLLTDKLTVFLTVGIQSRWIIMVMDVQIA